MADSHKNNQQRHGATKKKNRRSNSARDRLLQNTDERLSGMRRRKRLNTPLYSKRSLPSPALRVDYICPMCAERISNLVEAIECVEGGGPSHFGCVIRKLEKIHLTDKTQERIVYRGQGSFMVVKQMRAKKKTQPDQNRSTSPATGLLIQSTISYEIQERQAWRKGLTNRLMEKILEV